MFSKFRKLLLFSGSRIGNHTTTSVTRGPVVLHYPLAVGDLVLNRYRTKSRLGGDWGTRSTVWLSEDEQTKSNVILKITGSDATAEGSYSQRESQFLEKVSQQGRHPNVMKMHDHFTLSSKHGTHACMVLDVLGLSLAQLQMATVSRIPLPVPACKEIMRQILFAVDFLHRQCGIVHTDIKGDNVLLRLENIGGVNLKQTPLDYSQIKIGPSSIVLSDLGVASWSSDPFDGVIQPFGLRAPEVFLGIPYTPAVDVWNMGVFVGSTILSLGWTYVEYILYSFTRLSAELECLFQKKDDRWTLTESILTQMMCFAPTSSFKFPLDLIQRGKYGKVLFDMNTGTLKNKLILPEGYPMLYVMNRARPGGFTAEDQPELLADLLSSMIELRPEDRPSVNELLQHKWFQ